MTAARISRSRKRPDGPSGETALAASPAPRAQAAPTLSPDAALQRATRLGHRTVQTKLTLGPADDRYEREADAVARDVVRQVSAPGPRGEAAAGGPEGTAQRQGAGELDEEDLKTKRAGSVQRQGASAEVPDEEDNVFTKRLPGVEGGALDADVERSIETARGGGRALDEGVRGSMEGAFGADFSSVKVHTGSQADSLNQSLQARAFTTGQDIFFRQGEYEPGSAGGQELLAHELTHVVQQGGGAVRRLDDGDLGSYLERRGTERTAPGFREGRAAGGGSVERPGKDGEGAGAEGSGGTC